MTASDLRAWLVHMGYTQEQAAAALGMSRSALARMLAGGPIDKRTGLACVALAAGMGEWRAYWAVPGVPSSTAASG